MLAQFDAHDGNKSGELIGECSNARQRMTERCDAAKELLDDHGRLKLKEVYHSYETLVPRLPSYLEARFPVVDFPIGKFVQVCGRF